MLINQGKSGELRIDENGAMRFRDRVCVRNVPGLKEIILEEGHRSSLSIQPVTTSESYATSARLLRFNRIFGEDLIMFYCY